MQPPQRGCKKTENSEQYLCPEVPERAQQPRAEGKIAHRAEQGGKEHIKPQLAPADAQREEKGEKRGKRAVERVERAGQTAPCRPPQPHGAQQVVEQRERNAEQQRGEKAPQRTECSADLTVSANLPESYISSGEQRMDIYRRIAALRTAEQSQELLDELIDRYGEPPPPVLRLMDIALLRAEAMQIGVCDIAQRGSEISFTFAGADAVPVNAVMALCSLPKNRRRLTLSATGTEPKLLLRLTPNEDALDTALTLVGDLRVNKEENEKEVTL